MNFKHIKTNYKKYLVLIEFQTYFDRNNNKIPIMNEETSENTYISKEILKDKVKQLNQLTNNFKKNIKEFKETGELQS